ncbi:ABC transporter ATP-binding protein [Cellulomonas bogoriensis]|uniref:ABC transporter ATP-binding protein n=1 Tax=Cellulomonas bogoriensis 69B4 = DSM 16987 TaxID=1386082 RepID=A0A0A0BMH8_9CELL|nr:ABC transporter ATP-binding protein [Cellulomonas bogoriensis]KGM09161.1 ABC transporter ATP-binding protein [Cellulomonas bogoriensis 69B4 = DSM 16987]
MTATAVRSRPATNLRFAGTDKTYADGTVALTGVDLEIRQGDFVSVVGPSGCGKSTLLRLASGLEEPTGGVMEVDRGSLAYVFQDATLLPWRTVEQNVRLLGELHHLGKGETRRRAAEAIELVGLSGFEKHMPHQLSGGMRMRTSLARSLTLAPSLFLFDEPFGALDEISRERLNSELLTLFTTQEFAALFITHSINEAVFLSTQVAVMSGRPGRIVGRVDVPFPYPRDPEIRYTPRFAEICAELSDMLRGAS